MSSKKSQITPVGLLVVCAVLISVVIAAFGYDVYRDRQHILTFVGPVRVFENPEPKGFDRTDVVAVLSEKDNAKVLRIWYGKDYEGIKIQLSDGRVGYLISGESGDYRLAG